MSERKSRSGPQLAEGSDDKSLGLAVPNRSDHVELAEKGDRQSGVSVTASAVGMGLALQSGSFGGLEAFAETPSDDVLDAKSEGKPDDSAVAHEVNGSSAYDGAGAEGEAAQLNAIAEVAPAEPEGERAALESDVGSSPEARPSANSGLSSMATPLPSSIAASTAMRDEAPPPSDSIRQDATENRPAQDNTDSLAGDNGILDSVTSQDGVLDLIIGDDGLVGSLAGDDGVVDSLLDGVTGVADSILSPVLGDDGLVGSLVGDDGVVDSLLDGVTDAADGILSPVLGDDGVVDALLGDDGLVGSLVGDDGVVDSLLDGVTDAADGILLSVLGDDGIVGGLLGGGGDSGTLMDDAENQEFPLDNDGDGGFLDTLIGGMGAESLLETGDPFETLIDGPQNSVLQGLLGDEDVFGVDVAGASSGLEDLFAGLTGIDGLSGSLIDGGLLDLTQSTDNVEPDSEIDGLLNDILAGGVEDILGGAGEFGDLLGGDEGADADLGSDGLNNIDLIDDTAVDGALGILFDQSADQAGSLLDGLFGSDKGDDAH